MRRKAYGLASLVLASVLFVVMALAQEPTPASAEGQAAASSTGSGVSAAISDEHGAAADPSVGAVAAAEKESRRSSLSERLQAIRRSVTRDYSASRPAGQPQDAPTAAAPLSSKGEAVSPRPLRSVLTNSDASPARPIASATRTATASPRSSAGDGDSSRRSVGVVKASVPDRGAATEGERVLLAGRSPSLSVEAAGPSAVLMGKPAPFLVRLANSGDEGAAEVKVRLGLPPWVQVSATHPSAGVVQRQADGQGAEAWIWTIDHVGARSREQLSLELTPQENRGFDLGLDWTCRPCSSTAAIEVRQPLLEMAVTGPKELLFGQSKLYTIALANPGTGDAENVVVTLAPGRDGPSRPIGTIPAGGRREIQVELTASQAGAMAVRASAEADGGLRAEATHEVLVRRADLAIRVEGPRLNFAGAKASYRVLVANTGDAVATDVAVRAVLPAGARFVAGDFSPQQQATGLVWRAGDVQPGAERTFHLECELTTPGQNRFVAAADTADGLAASDSVTTQVEAVADLKLTVNDPQGPQAVGQDVVYELHITNRGAKAARQVHVVAQFSNGVEPVAAEGARAEIVPGQAVFEPILQISPGQQVTLRIRCRAQTSGNHLFRAQVQCADPETRLASEDSTQFFGDNAASVANEPKDNSATQRR